MQVFNYRELHILAMQRKRSLGFMFLECYRAPKQLQLSRSTYSRPHTFTGRNYIFSISKCPFIIKVSSQPCVLQPNSFCKVNTQKNPSPLIQHCGLLAYVGNALQNLSYCLVLRYKDENNVFKHFSTDVQGMSLTSCTLKK